MKVCDNGDSDNRAVATISASLKIFLIRVQFNFCSGEVKLLENGVFGNYETIAGRSQSTLS
jgi:hypothetical protein